MWVVAPGALVLQESGGTITDAKGERNDLIFYADPNFEPTTVPRTKGILGARKSNTLWYDFLEAYRSASQRQ